MRRVFRILCVASVTMALGYVAWTLGRPEVLSTIELIRLSQMTGPAPVAAARLPSKPVDRTGPLEPQRGTAPADAGAALKLDVARIDAHGVSVLAGRAPAGQRVSVVANGREVASAVASENGQWSAITTEGFTVGPLEIELVARPVVKGAAVAGLVTRSMPVQMVVPPGDGRAELAVASRTDRKAVTVTAAAAPAADKSGALARFEALVDRARDAGANTAAKQNAPVPVPITFVTGEAAMTAMGTKAASLLVEYLPLLAPKGIVLSGHADSRGSDGYNMDLSKRRLEAIERYLRGEGYGGRLALLPKGEHEPYDRIDRVRLARDDVYQADRRVELRLTQ